MNEPYKLKAILYWQTTADAEDNKKKEADLRQYCESNQYVVCENEQLDISSPKEKRMREILDLANNGVYDILITHSIYDMARDSTELLRVLSEIHQSPKIHFISFKENINSRFYDSREMLRLAKILLEFKTFRLSERVKSVMQDRIRKAKEEGRVLGKRGADKKKRQVAGYIRRAEEQRSENFFKKMGDDL